MLCYKYRQWSQQTIEVLLNKEIYFANPASLNDPLDSTCDITLEYQKVVDKFDPKLDEETNRKAFLLHLLNQKSVYNDGTEEQKTLNEVLQTFLKDVGIFSLSKTARDALLWSHYGDAHRGICLGFETDELIGVRNLVCGSVQYLAHPPYQDIFIELMTVLGKFVKPWEPDHHYPDELGTAFSQYQKKKLLEGNLMVKSEKWKYEEEYRLINVTAGRDKFSSQALKEIVLGSRTTTETKKGIKNLLKMPGYGHVKLRQVRHLEGSFEFEIIDA